MELPEDVQDLCRALLHGLKAALGDKLYALYIFGAVVFPDSAPTGDLDFHVILERPLNDQERSEIQRLHARLAQDFPPLGVGLDGYYILLQEARQAAPPRHQLLPGVSDASWALHRAHARAGRCVVLLGPPPEQVVPPASWPELERALRGELDYVEKHLEQYPDYCILNLCRLMYSFEKRDVVISKAAAAVWAWERFPQWREHIEAARRSYARQATAQDVRFMESQVGELYRFACAHIQESLGRRGADQGSPG